MIDRIPSSFELMGITINIVFDKTLHERTGSIGQADYAKCRIVLDDTIADEQHLNQAIRHEALHWIFYMLGEHKLRTNEKLVDTMGHLLYQMDLTAKYDEPKRIEETANIET